MQRGPHPDLWRIKGHRLSPSGSPRDGGSRGGASSCRKGQRTALLFDHQRGGLLQKAPRRGQKSSICEEFLMADFTLDIPTWANAKRGKGKPTPHLFSTHISTISVHGGRVFCKYPHDQSDCSQPLMSCKQPAEAPKRAPDHSLGSSPPLTHPSELPYSVERSFLERQNAVISAAQGTETMIPIDPERPRRISIPMAYSFQYSKYGIA